MDSTKSLLVFSLVLCFFAQSSSASVVISLTVDPVYGVGEAVPVYGTILEEINGSQVFLSNAVLDVTLENSSGSVYSETQANSSSSGEFSTEGLTAPGEAGDYVIRARFTDSENATWESVVSIRIMEHSVDELIIQSSKMDYYAGEAVEVTVSAVKNIGGSSAGVPNVSVNGTLRDASESIISFFNCMTDVMGSCNINLNAPLTAGEYILEVNEFAGSTVINVIPFDVSVDTMDDNGNSIKTTYTPGQSGKIRVLVSYNGTNPTVGTYSFSGQIKYSNGTTVEEIPTTSINSTTYTGFHSFTLDNKYSVGAYEVDVEVSQQGASPVRILAQGGSTVSVQAFFEVGSFQVSLEKESGFRYSYTAFPESNVSFKITLTDLSTGNPITSLSGVSFNITLESQNGRVVGAYNATLNTTHYNLRFTLPSEAGSYILRVKTAYLGNVVEAQRTITVADSMASATPSDSEGKLKEVFDSVEYIYIKLSLENTTSGLNITDIELSSIVNMDGATLSYALADWSSDGNDTLEWRKDVSSAMIKLDNPKSGGVYFVDVYLNNRTALAKTKFIIDPYSVVVETQDENENVRWQFSSDETVYVELTVTRAQHSSGSAMMAFEKGMYSTGSGGGTAAGNRMAKNPAPEKPPLVKLSAKSKKMLGIYEANGSTAGGTGTQMSGTEVSGARVEIIEVMNDRIYRAIPLSELNYSCTQTDTQGKATCNIKPASGSWDGGWYYIVFLVTGSDNVTKGLGYAGFEVRSFYIYAYSMEWMHKPTDDLTFMVQMYDAGNTMWWTCYYGGCGTSSGGLDGRVTVEKILRYGSAGEWTWPPAEYNYTGTLPAVTVRNGQGNFTLNAPSGGWKSGSYSIVLRGETTDAGGNVTGADYGDVWFEIKSWDVYADPVDLSTMQWKQGGFSTKENITLFINIHSAGSWGDGVSLGGLVTVRVKKIEDYSSWPSRELSTDEYTVYPISVNKSASLWSTPNPRYVLVIESLLGKWTSGYYNVVLDVNSSETGWGWFEVVAFRAEAEFVNENGTQIYTARGSGPIYFNVSSHSGSTPINTNVSKMTLRTWNPESWYPVEYTYPGGLNVTPVAVDGSTILQVSLSGSSGGVSLRSSENFPTGYYDAEIVLEDSEGETSTARAWFQVKPFEVVTETYSWEISSGSPFNVSLKTIEDYSTYYSSYSWTCYCYTGGILWGNYTIDNIKEYTYSMWGPSTETNITDYMPTQFNGTANLVINPPGGRWGSGYHSLVVTIKDDAENTGQAWIGFNAQPFRVTITQYPGAVGNRQNVSVGLNLPQTLNVSRVYEWVYSGYMSSEVDYNYTPASLPAGDVNLTIVVPSSGWTQGYSTWHSLTIVLTDGVDNSSVNVWFEVRSFQASVWSNPAGKDENITLNVNVYEPDWVTPATVNVIGVEYKNWNSYGGYSGGEYEQANYSVATNSTIINGSGTITLRVPSGGWDEGWYDTRVYLSGESNQTVFTSFSIATCDKDCGICDTEEECNRSSAYCKYDNLSDNDNTTGKCFSGYSAYTLTCSNDCYSCKNSADCEASSMNCDWSSGSCVMAGMTCDSQCSYCYTESTCVNSSATLNTTEWNGTEYATVSKGCVWDSPTSFCTFQGQTCNDHCWNCNSNASCGLSSANCTWSSKQYYCKDASQTCARGCYNCYDEAECSASAANCSWNSMYQSCYEAWQTCNASCGYCYTETECVNSKIGKCGWMGYYCAYNYTCSDDCYYCKNYEECSSNPLGCYWETSGDWCSINWSTCARNCYSCPTESQCVNSTLSCEWNNVSKTPYCQQGCSDSYCSSCGTEEECDSTSSCFWSNASSTCKYSWQNCSQYCGYCDTQTDCEASTLNCAWNYGYCNKVYTCNESCSSCLNETECGASTQNCMWRSWGVCEYDYGCSSGCTYCNTELECGSSPYGCTWDALDGRCTYSGSTCNDYCSNCYTRYGCENSNYSTTIWNGSEYVALAHACLWDNLTDKCVIYGNTCNDYCYNCKSNSSCIQSNGNCTWDRFNNYCTTPGSTCDENCHNCYSVKPCVESSGNCTWDSLTSICSRVGEPTCSTNCSLCTWENPCNLSAANCTWDMFGYKCVSEETPICGTNCSLCTWEYACNNSAAGCMWDGFNSKCVVTGAPICDTNCSLCTWESACNQSTANCTWDGGNSTCLEAGGSMTVISPPDVSGDVALYRSRDIIIPAAAQAILFTRLETCEVKK